MRVHVWSVVTSVMTKQVLLSYAQRYKRVLVIVHATDSEIDSTDSAISKAPLLR